MAKPYRNPESPNFPWYPHRNIAKKEKGESKSLLTKKTLRSTPRKKRNPTSHPTGKNSRCCLSVEPFWLLVGQFGGGPRESGGEA
jgi:hypothetical protein